MAFDLLKLIVLLIIEALFCKLKAVFISVSRNSWVKLCFSTIFLVMLRSRLCSFGNASTKLLYKYNLRNVNSIPRCIAISYGKNSIEDFGPLLWSKLPKDVKML